MKIKELINIGIQKLNKNNIEDSSLITKKLLQKLLNITDTQIVIKSDEQINQDIVNKYEEMLNKIIEGIPLQYITNEKYFYGIKFYVDENVLIPQPDTEILVEEVINICKNKNKEIKILDMCTGSGCIGICLAKNIKDTSVTLVDISNKALEVAEKNAKENNAKVEIIQSDMFENIKDKYDIIVSNPPYIETDTIKTLSIEVQNEPNLALDGGEDGLKFYRILANNAYRYLNEDGFICMEIGYNQKETVIKILEETQEYKNTYCKKDLAGNDRVIMSQK